MSIILELCVSSDIIIYMFIIVKITCVVKLNNVLSRFEATKSSFPMSKQEPNTIRLLRKKKKILIHPKEKPRCTPKFL